MARTPIYHEEKKALIIRAALATFAKYGYEGTTNKLIGEEAGKLIGAEGKKVSPSLIYHYFPEGKAQLFKACIEQFPPIQKFNQILLENQDQPPEVFLRVIAQTYNDIIKLGDVLPIMRLVIGEGGRQPELVNTLFGTIAPNLIAPMLLYFENQIRAGNTRAAYPDQLGMQLLAPIMMRQIVKRVVGERAEFFVRSSDEEFIENLVQTILRGNFHE
jgi:AcrR family transcriptional regulator